MQETNCPQPKSSRRWVQFRVRTWLLFAAALAIPLAIYGPSIERRWRRPEPMRETSSSEGTIVIPPWFAFTNVNEGKRPIVILEEHAIPVEEEERLGIDLEPDLPRIPMLPRLPNSRSHRTIGNV